ncbi:MAG: glycosyltransferase family 87 protein [Anaerolineae bacterium]
MRTNLLGNIMQATLSSSPSFGRRVVAWLTYRRAVLYSRTLLVALLVGWVISQVMSPGVADLAGTPVGSDFTAFYSGGKLVLDGRSASLYHLRSQREVQVAILADPDNPWLSPFVNPPFVALAFAPFALLPYLPALALWYGLGLLASGLAVGLLRGELGLASRMSLPGTMLLAFQFFPTMAWFIYGQNTPFTLLLYVAAFVLLRRGKDAAAGLCVGALIFKPQLAIALGVVLLLQRRWRAVLAAGCVAALCVLVGVLALGPDLTMDYASFFPRLTGGLLRLPGYPRFGLHSLFGFSSLLLDGVSVRAADLLATCLTLAALGFLVALWRKASWQPGSRDWDILMASTFSLGLIISPHLFVYDLMLLVLPLAILWSVYPGGTNGRLLDGGPLLVATAALWVVTVLSTYIARFMLIATELAGLPATAVQLSLPVLVWWVCMLQRLRSSPPRWLARLVG